MVEAAGNSEVLESERLPNPCNDRVKMDVKAPPIIPLTVERAFTNNKINAELVKNYLFEGGKVSKECLLEIMR